MTSAACKLRPGWVQASFTVLAAARPYTSGQSQYLRLVRLCTATFSRRSLRRRHWFDRSSVVAWPMVNCVLGVMRLVRLVSEVSRVSCSLREPLTTTSAIAGTACAQAPPVGRHATPG
jgi:hypothetical protein